MGESMEWVSPCYGLQKHFINGLSLCSFKDLSKECKLPMNVSTADHFFFMNISGEKKSGYLMKTNIQQESADPLPIDQMIEECFILFDNAWLSYEDLMHFYISPKFSLFLILELGHHGKLKILSVMLYHHNPQVGTFIPLLNVNKADQKKKIGPSSFMLIQYLFFKRFDTYKLSVWIALTSNKPSEKLYLFYRRLGFYAFYPKHLPIESLVRNELYLDMCKELERSIKGGDIPADWSSVSSNSCTYDFKDGQQNFLFMTNRKIEFQEKRLIVNKYLQDSSHVISNNLVCELCGLERSLEEDIKPFKIRGNSYSPKNAREFFSFCRHKIDGSQCLLETTPVCGMTFCLTCRSSFGNRNDTFCLKYCPVHSPLYSKNDRHEIVVDGKVRKMSQAFVNKHINSTRQLKDNFFSGFLENGLTGSNYCKMCIYGGIGSNVSGLDHYCKYGKIDERSIVNVRNSRECSSFQLMKILCKKNKAFRTSFQMACSNNCLHKYSYFDCNSGNPVTSLNNDIFGIKFVDGEGDCAFDAIRIALNSAEKPLKDKIVKRFETYLTKQLKKYKGLMDILWEVSPDNKKNKKNKKKKDKNNRKLFLPKKEVSAIKERGYLEVQDIRFAIFLTKVDPDYHKVIPDTMPVGDEFKCFYTEGIAVDHGFRIEDDYLERVFTPEELANNAKVAHFFEVLKKELQNDTQLASDKNNKSNTANHIRTILGEYEFGFLHNTINNMFKKYSRTSVKEDKGTETLLWAGLYELQYLPYITNGLIGVLVAPGSSSKSSPMLPCSFLMDSFYHKIHDKHIMQSCEYFIILKYYEFCHFEVLYDRKNKVAIFPTGNIENMNKLGDKMLPWNIVKSFMVDTETNYNLFGTQMAKTVSFPELSKHNILHGIECSYPTKFHKFYPDCSKALVENIENQMKKNATFKEMQKDLFYYPEWYKSWITIMDEIEKSSLVGGKDFLQRKLLNLVDNDVDSAFLPIIFIDKSDSLDYQGINKKMLFLQNVNSIHLVGNNDDDDQSYSSCSSRGSAASTAGKGSRFLVLDANRVVFGNLYKNKYARQICNTDKELGNYIFQYEVDLLELFEKFDLGVWKFPNAEDINRICSLTWYNECKASDEDGTKGTTQCNGCLQDIFGILPTANNVSKLKLELLKERSMLLCIQAETWQLKQQFYRYYVAFYNEDFQLYRHMLFNEESVVLEYLEKKYGNENMLKSFIMNSKSSQIKKIVHDTFAPHYQDSNQQDAYLERVAEELFLTVWHENQYPLFTFFTPNRMDSKVVPNDVFSNSRNLGSNFGKTDYMKVNSNSDIVVNQIEKKISTTISTMLNDQDSMKVNSNSDVVVQKIVENIVQKAQIETKNESRDKLITQVASPTANQSGSSSSGSETKRNDGEESTDICVSENKENAIDVGQKIRNSTQSVDLKNKLSLPLNGEPIVASSTFGKVKVATSQHTKLNATCHGYLLKYVTYLWEYDFKTALVDGNQKTLKDILIPLVFHETARKKFEKKLVAYALKKYNDSSKVLKNPTNLVKEHWSILRNAVLYHMGIKMIATNAVDENKSLFSYEINFDVFQKYQDDIQASMIYGSNESDDDDLDVSSISSVNSDIERDKDISKTVNFTKIKEKVLSRHKHPSKKDLQEVLTLIKKMELCTEKWGSPIEMDKKSKSVICDTIELNLRTASTPFQWVNGKYLDENCLKIGSFCANFREVNIDFLQRQEIPPPMMNVAIRIMNFEYSKKGGVLCLANKFLSGMVPIARSAQVLWTRKSLRKQFVTFFSTLDEEQQDENVNIIKDYSKLLVPWTRDNNHLLLLIDTKDKKVVIYNPNQVLLESKFVLGQLVKEIKYLVIAIITFGWVGEFKLSSVESELASYAIVYPSKEVFPSCTKVESSTMILLNIFALFTKQTDKHYKFFSTSCLVHFKQFLLSMFSEYHSCSEVRDKKRSEKNKNAIVLDKSHYFETLVLNNHPLQSKHSERILKVTDDTTLSTLSATVQIHSDPKGKRQNKSTTPLSEKQNIEIENSSNSMTKSDVSSGKQKVETSGVLVEKRKTLKEEEIKNSKDWKKKSKIFDDDLTDTESENSKDLGTKLSASRKRLNKMARDDVIEKVFVREIKKGKKKEYVEICKYLKGETKGSVNKEISKSVSDVHARITRDISRKLTYPQDETNPSSEFKNMKFDNIAEEDLKFYNQNLLFHTFEIIQKKLSCEFIICKRDGYYQGNEEENFLLSQSSRVKVPTRPSHEYSEDMRFYFLEIEAIHEFESNKEYGEEIKWFTKELRELDDDENGKQTTRTWKKMSDNFKKLLKNYLIEQRQSCARHYQDYHFIKVKSNGQLWGYCMHNRQVTYAEELSKDYIVDIEHYKKEYQQALKNVDTMVPLRIGSKGVRKKHHTIHKKQSTPAIQYPQGNQQKCLAYSLKSCFFYYMKNVSEVNEEPVIQGIIDKIEEITESEKIETNSTSINKLQKNVFVQLKDLFDTSGNWKFQRLDNTRKTYMQTNYGFLEDYLKENEKSIFLLQIRDNAGDDGHWVCVCNMLLFDTRKDFSTKFSEQALKDCAEKTYKSIGKMYEMKKSKKRNRKRRNKKKFMLHHSGNKDVNEESEAGSDNMNKRVKFNLGASGEKKCYTLDFKISYVYTKLNRIQKERFEKICTHAKCKKDDDDEVLCCERIPIKKGQFIKLSGKGWLNNDVVDAYSRLLAKRHDTLLKNGCVRKKSFFSGSFFLGGLFDEEDYTETCTITRLKKFVDNNEGYCVKDLFKSDKFFFPYRVPHREHWILYVVLVKEKTIQVYDSMAVRKDNVDETKTQKLLDLLSKMHKICTAEKNDFLIDEWKLPKSSIGGIPQQKNCYDCGIFVLMYIDLLSLNQDLSFTQEQATEYRQWIVLSLEKGDAFTI